MNKNLLNLIDQLTFAPIEKKSEILAILISENSIKNNKVSGLIGKLIVSSAILVLGKDRVKKSFQNLHIKNHKRTEELFLTVLDIIVQEEPLQLIQDLLYAIYISGWRFDPGDVARYLGIEKV